VSSGDYNLFSSNFKTVPKAGKDTGQRLNISGKVQILMQPGAAVAYV
jgi:hypothetical protein